MKMGTTITKPRMAHTDAGSEMQRWTAESGFGPRHFFFFTSRSKGIPANNVYTRSRETESQLQGNFVNLYNRQIMILMRKTITYATDKGNKPPSGHPGPLHLYRLFLPLVGTDAK